MKVYTLNGRVFDTITLQIDNDIILHATEYFNPQDISTINTIHGRLTRKKRKGNLVLTAYYHTGKRPETSGCFLMEYLPTWDDKETLKTWLQRLEYKDM